MASPNDPPSPAAARLDAIARELQDLGASLSPESAGLGPEHVRYITDTSQKMTAAFEEFRSHPEGWATLQSRGVRHDLRNHIGIIRGFCDLILLDLDSARPEEEQGLNRMIQLCEEFTAILETLNPEPSGDQWPH